MHVLDWRRQDVDRRCRSWTVFPIMEQCARGTPVCRLSTWGPSFSNRFLPAHFALRIEPSVPASQPAHPENSFAGALIENVDATGANLSQCRFDGAVLSNVRLARARLDGAAFAHCTLNRVNFCLSSKANCDWHQSVLTGCLDSVDAADALPEAFCRLDVHGAAERAASLAIAALSTSGTKCSFRARHPMSPVVENFVLIRDATNLSRSHVFDWITDEHVRMYGVGREPLSRAVAAEIIADAAGWSIDHESASTESLGAECDPPTEQRLREIEPVWRQVVASLDLLA